jgi:hypothetical protein
MLLFDAPRDPTAAAASAVVPATDATASRRRAALFIGFATAAVAGFALGDPAPRVATDPELATLLRGMAAIKALLLLGALALLACFGRPMAPRFAAIYVGGAAVMAFATALIWQLTALPFAATAFHVAEITLLIAAWRDLR